MKKSTIIHHDSLEVINAMPDEMAGVFIKKLLLMMQGEKVCVDDFALKMALHPFEKQFTRDNEKYEKQCEKNRLNGMKGGRPTNNPKNPSGYLETITGPKNPDNDNGSDNGNGNKKESDNKNKKIFGEFKNVLLTAEELKKLHEKFNSTTESRIEKLSAYKASKGKKYKSDYATILTWARGENKESFSGDPVADKIAELKRKNGN